jgi:uncharacterized membrane protein required for colicin V production
MIQLSGLMWGMALVFGFIGYRRGLTRELISTAGIVLGLFALFEFDELFVGFNPSQRFFSQALIFSVIAFFAYQTRALTRRSTSRQDGRDNMQSSLLGAIIGFLNGYLIWGSLWYFMHVNNYPLTPFISAPLAGSQSAATITTLPLFVLAGGPGGQGNLLALAVIILFLFVLILI